MELQVFVLRVWREATGGTWRGQIVHLPDQSTAAVASWDQVQAFVERFVLAGGFGQSRPADAPED